jgi:sugar lactone lactonase YvrE
VRDVKTFVTTDDSSTRWRHPAVKLAALLLLLAGVATLALFLYLRLREKPQPTVADWRAEVLTIAGTGAPGFADGAASQARFADPFGIAMDRAGNIFISDAGDNNRIRKLTPDAQISTLAGANEGFVDATGAAASFNTPSGLAVDEAGNLYVADTGNHAIRLVTPEGVVTTVAGDGRAGYKDGAGRAAQFNAPVGVAVDSSGNLYVADTYNDRIRKITPDGVVSTLAGGSQAGYQDGSYTNALFDTPCAVAVNKTGELYIADTGNNAIRKLMPDGTVSTFAKATPEGEGSWPLLAPTGIAITHDGFLYVTENDRGRIIQISPDGTTRVLAGRGNGFADGESARARLNNPAGIAVDKRGALYVADAANYLVRKVVATERASEEKKINIEGVVPRLSAETISAKEFPWPIDPQRQWHEVAATLGEVRGNYDGEARDHLHSGVDVQGAYGATVRVVHEEKVNGALNNWGFGSLGEGIQVGLMTYVHLHVGRDQKDAPFKDERFIYVNDEKGKPQRVRVRRGTRFRVGDALGTINRMYHVHLNFGPSGAQANPLVLPFIDFTDRVQPKVLRDGIQLYDTAGTRLTEKREGRLIVRGDASIVVEAYDLVDGSPARRRLGLYKLGYQVLRADGSPAPGFEQPRINIEFNRLPSDRDAVKIIYAEGSGITVYGNKTTRFIYSVNNIVRDGRAGRDIWRTSEMPKGDYILRIFAADYHGNEATDGRDLPIRIE